MIYEYILLQKNNYRQVQLHALLGVNTEKKIYVCVPWGSNPRPLVCGMDLKSTALDHSARNAPCIKIGST